MLTEFRQAYQAASLSVLPNNGATNVMHAGPPAEGVMQNVPQQNQIQSFPCGARPPQQQHDPSRGRQQYTAGNQHQGSNYRHPGPNNNGRGRQHNNQSYPYPRSHPHGGGGWENREGPQPYLRNRNGGTDDVDGSMPPFTPYGTRNGYSNGKPFGGNQRRPQRRQSHGRPQNEDGRQDDERGRNDDFKHTRGRSPASPSSRERPPPGGSPQRGRSPSRGPSPRQSPSRDRSEDRAVSVDSVSRRSTYSTRAT